MLTTWLIVDGYNVINKWPSLMKAKQKNIEFAREKLNTLIQKYCDFKGIKATIVYDGKGDEREKIGGNPEIIFSKHAETADTVIESLAHNHDNPDEITVATDDYNQRNFVIGAGARCIPVQEFEEEVNKTLEEMRKIL